MRRAIPLDRLAGLESPERGLSAAEVDQRQGYGANAIVEDAARHWSALAGETLRDPMLWFLLGTALLFGLLGDRAEALTLLLAVIPLLGMDAWLHQRTRASTAGLASRLAGTARVWRDGTLREIAARAVLPGDLAQVAPGEYFPADGVLVAGSEMLVDESTLTGEAFPVRKQVLAVADRFPAVADDCHWAAAGTRLLAGQATLRVLHTGQETRYGAIVRAAREGSHARTPLQQAIAGLVATLLWVALAMCLLLAAVRLVQGFGAVDALLSAVTLAVAALPEEFPVVFTFFLGVGVYRLARHKALVRRAVAVENIGRVTCICSDKTGTLTAGSLVLSHRLAAPGFDAASLLQLALQAVRSEADDPLDAALLAAGQAPDLAPHAALFPFTEQRRRETAIWPDGAGAWRVVTKGAPETLFALCDLDAAALAGWRRQVDLYAAGGHKVIACATRRLAAAACPASEPAQGFVFAGLLAFEDPLRDGVREAVAECRAAGIRVVMVTGDHPLTARAIAREIGLGGGEPKVLVAEPGCEWPDDVDVVARAIPAQKLELVRALQAEGEIVAVTGDGVNDVPALQAADVGITMGERGTQSAREIAAIVLLDDNFGTLVRAIGEGRQLFRNLQLSFAYLLLVHIPLVASATLVPLAGAPLLYLPIHVVWLELLIHPTALLVFQELAPDGRLGVLARRGPARFFSRRAWWAILLGGALITLVLLGAWWQALDGLALDGQVLAEAPVVTHARSMAIAVLVVASLTITASLSQLRSAMARAVCGLGLASLLLFVQLPALAARLHLQPLHLADWAVAALAGLLAGLIGRWVLGLLQR
ncbi:cation-transporting P-type ATPase [Pseudomonas sp. MAP12]|uniref:Cation-transporting P-type ATPase n=1 Tax=Geopseudomonas aromaticivorans TaxID=2849492 RepID=A0ABS6N1F5_9GAMM|nr:cation-transporting P-type ATPase [Pseudomonas aromaticivorans]MBV2134864.1 cation-transporting P-type ATPase [Pseudomonas aromaticivorans]